MARGRYYNKRDRYGRWSNGGVSAAPRKRSKGQRYAAYQTRLAAEKKATRNKRLKTAGAVALVAVGAVAAYQLNKSRVKGISGPGIAPQTGSTPITDLAPNVPAVGGKSTIPGKLQTLTTALGAVSAAQKLIPPGQVPGRSSTVHREPTGGVTSFGAPKIHRLPSSMAGAKAPKPHSNGKSTGISDTVNTNSSQNVPNKNTGGRYNPRTAKPGNLAGIFDPQATPWSYGEKYTDIATGKVITLTPAEQKARSTADTNLTRNKLSSDAELNKMIKDSGLKLATGAITGERTEAWIESEKKASQRAAKQAQKAAQTDARHAEVMAGAKAIVGSRTKMDDYLDSLAQKPRKSLTREQRKQLEEYGY